MSDNIKKSINVKFPTFDMNTENPYQEEMDKLIDTNLAEASTTRTLKNISETLTKSLKSKYGITDKEELKTKVNELLKLHGLSAEHFDPIAFISKQTFGELKTVNDISIDDNANKTDTNMTGICTEASLPYWKLAGYDYLYQVMKELYGTAEAKKCSANMYDFSLFLNDSTKINIPYCYCIDASKIVVQGRKFGQVHSSPAHRISTYVSILCDTIRELSFNLAGAVAIGTFFLDMAHLGIYRERITLDDLKNDKKVRKAMTNHFQQFIHSVNHYSRNAVESPFTNVSCFDRDKLKSLIDEDNYGWYFPKKAAVVEDNDLQDTKEAFKNFVLDYIEELQEIYIDVFDEGDPLRGGLQFPFPVTTCLPSDTSLVLNKKLTTFGEAFSDFDNGWTDVEDLYTIYQGKEVKIKKVFCGETTKLLEFSGMHGWPIKATPDHKFILSTGEKIKASDIKIGDKLMIDRDSKIEEFSKDYILVSDYINDLWVQGYELEYTDKVKSLFDFQESNRSYPELNAGNVKQSFRFNKIQQLSDSDFRVKPEIDMVKTKESKNKGNIPNKIMLDANFGRFLGLYYAEGHNSNGELGFSFNKNEQEYINFVVDYVQNVLKLKTKIRFYEECNSVQVCIYSRTLGILLDMLIGKYSFGKKLHSDLFDTPISFRENIARGIIEGDGNCNSYSCGITTTSKEGANSIGYLMTTLGISTKLSVFSPRDDEKRKVKGKHTQYYIDVNKFDVINNKYDFGKTINFEQKKKIMKPNCFIVKQIKEINTQEPIYNIEVDNEGHVYTLPFGLVTSNCNFGTMKDENGNNKLISEDNKLLNYITKKDISRYNIYCSEGTKVASCCFSGSELIKVYQNDNKEVIIPIEDFVKLYQNKPGQNNNIEEWYIDSLNSNNEIEKTKIVGVLNKNNNSSTLIKISINGKEISVTPDHKFKVKNIQTDEEEISALELSYNKDLYLLPVIEKLMIKWCKIDNLEILENQDNNVYDIELENNHYFPANNIISHNCRLLSDSDFLAYAGGVNSFGGSQVSLGSHRVVTINFARAAYEAESYDDFKKIVSERVEMMGKILKAHKMLILKLEKLGKQPWITNGWIDMTHMFSTFGCVGYVEADEILHKKFDHHDFDYMKDFLVYFNDECKRVADNENIIFNIEAIPAEGAAPKIAKADKLIYGDENGEYHY